SIAIYILDKNKKISNHYIIVLKKILLAVDKIFKDYTLKSKFKFQDAFYFYIVNDFYYYPGFKSYIAKKSFQNLNKNFKSMKEEIKREGFSQIETNLLTNRSYFNWEIDFRWFFKKAILKSENISYSTTNNDY
ncbi:hypothetical protein, partial [Paenibacillus nuruki]|uniref:hypothetical protein n=1 Tax=Paenibacillus nuruki TaxID=1886670 RepID=UPI001586255A